MLFGKTDYWQEFAGEKTNSLPKIPLFTCAARFESPYAIDIYNYISMA